MDAPFEITLQIILAVIAGVSAQVLAEYLKVPAIVLLLVAGIAIGPDGIGWLRPTMLGPGLDVIVSLFVAVILFEGGLSLDLRALGRVSGSLRNLVTIGTLITLIGGGVAAHWLGEFPWSIAFLYASLVVVTGPTVISPLLRQVQVDRRIATLLEGEGVLIDPVGAILAVVVLNIILNGDADLLAITSSLGMRLGIGLAIGGLGGSLLGFILRRAVFLSDELRNLVVLAGVWGLYGLSQITSSESGLMATVIAGIVVGNSAPSLEQRPLRRFKGQLTILAVSFLFILLAADLSIASVFALGWGSGLTVLALMLVVRPLNVLVCTWNSDLNWRQKIFLSWIAPRGIISASVASLFAILLTERGINGGDAIKALVFLTIMSTVFVQGLTARWVANWLGITANRATGLVIVGCNPLSVLIGRLFRDQGEPIALIDTNPEAARLAEQESLPVFISSGLDTIVLERAGLAYVGTFLAMTSNAEVNLVVAQQAAAEFQPPRVLATFPGDAQSATTIVSGKVQQAFAPEPPVKAWSQYLLDNAVKLGGTMIRSQDFDAQNQHLHNLIQAGSLMPFLIRRQSQLLIVSAKYEWQPGDRLIYLLHDPKSKLLKLLSGRAQTRLAIETIPQVETLPQPEPPPQPSLPSPGDSSPPEASTNSSPSIPPDSMPDSTADEALCTEPTEQAQAGATNLSSNLASTFPDNEAYLATIVQDESFTEPST